MRHVLELPHGRLLDPVPVVEGSLDPHAPAAMKALYERLHREFGAVASTVKARAAAEGSRLHALQGGIAAAGIGPAPQDDRVSFYG